MGPHSLEVGTLPSGEPLEALGPTHPLRGAAPGSPALTVSLGKPDAPVMLRNWPQSKTCALQTPRKS